MDKTEDQDLARWAQAARERWTDEILPQNDERVIHRFLQEHAGLFLTKDPWEGVVVSKLKLGASYETDFVIVQDEFSAGFVYKFVEIEIPDTRLFTKPSKPIDRLNTAISQVNSWEQWLRTHPQEALDLLPSKSVRHGHPPRYEFYIIIGRRDAVSDTQAHPDRGWIREQTGIKIRSFDSLTDNASWWPWTQLSPSSGYPRPLTKELSRRDWRAMSHTEWIAFVRSMGDLECHLYEHHWEQLLEFRNQGHE